MRCFSVDQGNLENLLQLRKLAAANHSPRQFYIKQLEDRVEKESKTKKRATQTGRIQIIQLRVLPSSR
jgi:hypothetical protein